MSLNLCPNDARHLFYEEIQQLIEAMREIEPEELKSKPLGDLLRQADRLLNMLRHVKGRRPVRPRRNRSPVR